jgi:hypothetical protein
MRQSESQDEEGCRIRVASVGGAIMPRKPAARAAEQAAAVYLWELLRLEGPYRDTWTVLAHAENLDVIEGEVNEQAVRRLVTDNLWREGELSEDPRRLDRNGRPTRPWNDRIYDIRNGLRLSPSTLRAFIGAFEMSEEDQERLWRIHAGTETSGRRVPSPRRPVSGLKVPPAEHQTITLHEFHYLGPDGLPHHHETLQCIRSLVDNLTSYPYRFDTDEVRDVKVRLGGKAGGIYHVQDRVYAFDITLDTPLKLHEEVCLRYITRFSYKKHPPPDFRRAVPRTAEAVEIHVFFDKRRLPSAVWFVVWEDWPDGSKILYQEPVSLDANRAVYRCLTQCGGTVVGYRWEW